MKELFFIVGVLMSFIAWSQTQERIDSLYNETTDVLDHYDHFIFSNNKVLNEDAVEYDTAYFYNDKNGELIYINWQKRTHTFHLAGDNIDVTEFLFMNGNVVFKRNYSYRFLNPQWHLELDLNETRVLVVESVREYYKEDGSPLIVYKAWEMEGKYKDVPVLLNKIPLEVEPRRRWSSRCDECIDEEYLSIYRKLLTKRGN